MDESEIPTQPTSENNQPKEKSGLATELRKIKLDRTPTNIANNPDYERTLPILREVYKDVEFWHGTGRYKYSSKGEVTDILDGLLQEGGLVPHSDDWDRKRGVIHTVSLAPSRMYARLYAGMYVPNGGRIENELGTRELWGYYFFGTSMIAGILEYRPSLQDIRKGGAYAIGNSIVPEGGRKTLEWGGKITKQKASFTDIFLKGTDIEQNYPILIGVKKGVVEPTESSRFIGLHERRSEQPVFLKDFSHIEVPKDKVEETTQMLQRVGYDRVPVIPIEYGEEYCRQFSFLKLAGKKPLVSK